jgi:hypothetical protein
MRMDFIGNCSVNNVTIKGKQSTVPGLAITRAYASNGKATHTGYRVTHVGSLLCVGLQTATYAQAKAIALLLAHMTDWTQTEDQVKAAVNTLGGRRAINRVRQFVIPAASEDAD